ncbi:unnamed protein product, partial [Pylaiella littoralis]
MEEPALWRPAAAAETKDRGMESTRESKSRIRNKSIAAVPAPRSQPNRRIKSDLGSKMFMAGSSVASRPCPRRGSLSMLAYQSRMLELEKSGAACVRSNDKSRPVQLVHQIQPVLDSSAFLGFTAVASTVALFLAVMQTESWQEWHSSDRVWAVQLLLAAGAASELVFRLLACGPSYCSDWVSLFDTFVVVGGACLTASMRTGSAVLFLRIVRIAALSVGRGWSTGGTQETLGDLDENPAVQLYRLVMRAMRESTVFTA